MKANGVKYIERVLINLAGLPQECYLLPSPVVNEVLSQAVLDLNKAIRFFPSLRDITENNS